MLTALRSLLARPPTSSRISNIYALGSNLKHPHTYSTATQAESTAAAAEKPAEHSEAKNETVTEREGSSQKLEDLPPKRPLTPYGFFNVAQAKKADTSSLAFGKWERNLSEKWKSMNDSEKAPYHQQFREARAAYNEEIKEWMKKLSKQDSQEAAAQSQGKESNKSKGHVPFKRPPSSWVLFIKSRIPSEPDRRQSGKEWFEELSVIWRGMTDVEKEPFNKQYKEAKAEYDRAIDEWIANTPDAILMRHRAAYRNQGKKTPISGPALKRTRGAMGPTSNAYSIFFKDQMSLHSLHDYSEGMDPTEKMKIVGAKWRVMSETEKDVYREKHRASMAEYNRKNAERLTVIEKPTKPYLMFYKEQKSLNDIPEGTLYGEFKKIIGARWRALSKTERNVYHARYRAAKAEYEQRGGQVHNNLLPFKIFFQEQQRNDFPEGIQLTQKTAGERWKALTDDEKQVYRERAARGEKPVGAQRGGQVQDFVPIKNLLPFKIFLREQRQRHDSPKGIQLTQKTAGERWKALTDDEKQVYRERAAHGYVNG